MFLKTLFASLLFFSIHSTFAAYPLSGCQAGRAVPNANILNTNGVCGYGAWNSASGPGSVYIASVNQAFFNNGARCGECYELTGPLGSVVVNIVDYCPSSSDKCGGDTTNFVLSTEAFLAIADNETDIIVDLGFRQVSCPTTNDVGLKFGSGSSAYYFSVLPYNAKIAVASMAIEGSGWGVYESLTRSTDSASFAWNKNTRSLTFPATIQITSETGAVITKSFTSIPSSAYIDAGAQFPEVPAVEINCTMSVAEPIIYSATAATPVGLGWDDSYGFKLISQGTASDGSLHAVMGSFGAVQFTRDGGFETDFWSSISFLAKTSTDQFTGLRVYLGSDAADAVSVGPISASGFTNVTVTFASLNAASVVPSIVIQNNLDVTVDLYLSSVMLVRDASVPADAAPVNFPSVSTTSAAGGSTTSNNNNGGTGNSNENGTGTGNGNGNGNGNGDDTTATGSHTTTATTTSSDAVSNTMSTITLVAVFSTLLVVLF